MTEPDETAAPTSKPMDFRGRTVEVLEPSDEQLVALVRFSKLRPAAEMTPERLMGVLNRAPELARRLCAAESDAEWLEDSLVDGTLKLDHLPEFLALVVDTWYGGEPEPTNRATKRAAAKKTAKSTAARAR